MAPTRSTPRFLYIVLSIPILLLIPLVAMQFSSEVLWTGSDFLIMGVLLLLAGGALEGVLRLIPSGGKRWLWIALIAVLFFLVYAELAVGLFNSPWAGS